MRIKCEDHSRPSHLFGQRIQPLDNPRMPLVHAVEVANRDSAAPHVGRQVMQLAEQNHERRRKKREGESVRLLALWREFAEASNRY